jgi:hypothetical protein
LLRRTDFIRLVLFVFLALRLSAGQSTNGTISGIVFDPGARAIPGAEILIVNDVTGISYAGATNSEGIYEIPNLLPGPYRIQVSKLGFKTLIKPDVVLHLEDALAINFTLPLGAASEVVTVQGGAPLINTENAAVSTVIDSKYVANMPLNGRSFQDLILLTPGAVTQTPQVPSGASGLGQTGEFSINGQRPESNYYTVDGASMNVGAAPGLSMTNSAGASGSVAAATALGTTQALVSVDDLEEFRVQSSTYSAEYGRNPGGQFSFETKSGGNEAHGSAYDYLRNGVFDANDWFNDYFGTREPALRQNDFGGTFGGPIEIPRLFNGKDRSFFFVSYEGLRLDQPQAAAVNNVPDMSLRATAPAPLNQVLNAFPVPNGRDDAANGIAQYIASWSNPSSLDSTSVRLDHTVTGKLRLFFRFSDTPSTSVIHGSGVGTTPSYLTSTDYASRTYTAGATSAFSQHLSNQFRINYSSNQVTSSSAIEPFGGNTPVDLAQLAGLGASASDSIVLDFGGYDIGIAQARNTALQRQWNVVDTAGASFGRHLLKFGVDFRRLSPIANQASPFLEYLYVAKPNVDANLSIAIAGSYAPAFPLYLNFSAFAQDEWKASARLTLSYGIRWEVNPAPGVTKGVKPYTVEGQSPSAWTLAPEGTPLWRTAWYNFAPRLGAAYVFHNKPGCETVLRAGGGVFYDTGQQLGSAGFAGPGLSSGLNIHFFVPFPLPMSEATPPIPNPPVAPYNTVYAYPSHLQLPYTLEWNASLEQAIGKSQAFTVSYVGSHGARLLKLSELSGSAIGNPNAANFYVFGSGLTSDYDSLQLQYQRRLSQGLTALASDTYSHCIDYGSQNYFVGYQRGNCDFDVRHNLSTAFSYDAPNARRGGFAGALLRHWSLDDRFSVRSGFPVLLHGLPVTDPISGSTYFSGLNRVQGEPTYISGAQCASFYDNHHACPGGRAINPGAFVLPEGCSFLASSCPPGTSAGNEARNSARGFGALQIDSAVRREFPIFDRFKLQFRAEAFNVLNHPNFGTIDENYCSPDPASPNHSSGCTFGQATGTLASTLGVLSPIYQTGGPRSMQFALKLIF